MGTDGNLNADRAKAGSFMALEGHVTLSMVMDWVKAGALVSVGNWELLLIGTPAVLVRPPEPSLPAFPPHFRFVEKGDIWPKHQILYLNVLMEC